MGLRYCEEIVSDTSSVSVPPGPVTVSEMVVMPLSCGVPVMTPVVALIIAQLGRPVADQFVAGRPAAFVRSGVLLNAVPTLPVKFCPAVISGSPAEMVKATEDPIPTPPGPVAETEADAFCMRFGTPETTLVSWLMPSPAGNHVSCRFVAGRSIGSVRAMVALNEVPTLPVKLWPVVTMGTPKAIAKMTSSVSVPPGPVTVSVIVVVPLSCGVPVTLPVEPLSVAQLGRPVADQLVTGRSTASVIDGVALNATPTLPAKFWPAGMMGGE